MLDLNFQIEGAEPQKVAAEPMLLFKLRVTESSRPEAPPTRIQTIALRCQVRIEPGRRHYEDVERDRLRDLFGSPERWGQTLRPMLWTHVTSVVPAFTGTDAVELPVPCSFDFSLAATRYFAALDGGDLPLCFLFSGTVFYESEEGAIQAGPIPWDKDAYFRLPAATWRDLMDAYYPKIAWLSLQRDMFDRLDRYRTRESLPSWEGLFERLLSAAGESVTP